MSLGPDAGTLRLGPRRRRKIGPWVAGLALVMVLAVCIHTTTGWMSLIHPWGVLGIGGLTGGFLLLLLSYVVRTIRVYHYFRREVAGHFLCTLRIVGVHNLFNNLLPMRLGEASFPILMKREFGVSLRRSVPGLMYLRLLDLHAVLLLGLTLFARQVAPFLWPFVGLLAAAPVIGFVMQERIRMSLVPRGRITTAVSEGLLGLPRTLRDFGWTWAWTGANWVAKLAVLSFVLRTFAPVSWSDALLGSVAGELSSVLPVHGIAGLGTYEGGVIAGLFATGNGAAMVLAGAVDLHLFVLGTSAIFGLLAILLPAGPRHGGVPRPAPRPSLVPGVRPPAPPIRAPDPRERDPVAT